jgi:hypothetical protein
MTTVQIPPDSSLMLKQVSPGMWIVQGAYEGKPNFFEVSPVLRKLAQKRKASGGVDKAKSSVR